MGEDEVVVDFAAKLTKVINDIRSIGESLIEGEVIQKLLRVAPEKFDSVTSSMDQFVNLDELTLEEIIGSLVVLEEKLQNRVVRKEENLLLAKATAKKDLEVGCGRGRGRSRGRGRGNGRGQSSNRKGGEEEPKPQDKSKVQCYNCDKYGHYALECRKEKKEEKANFAEKEEPQSSLLMIVEEKTSIEFLL